MDVEGMLRRIGATHAGPPSVEGLSGLHTAYVDQVPYETVQYQLGGGGPLKPEEDRESPFVRTTTVCRRRPTSTLVMRSVGLTETTATSIDNSLVGTPSEYFEALADLFHLPLPHYSAADRDALWRRVWAQYEDFLVKTARVN